MSDKLILYYSVENCGDGSAYPRWFETEKLAEWHQKHLDEGWGEPCTGSISVEGDNLQCVKLQSKEGYYLELLLEGEEKDEELNEFKIKFFPDGLPEFTAKIIDDPHYYGVFAVTVSQHGEALVRRERLVYKPFAYPEKTANAKGLKRLKRELRDL